jgi:hypothetical protein
VFRRIDVIAVIASLSLLAACTGGQPVSQGNLGVAPLAVGAGLPALITPDKDCGGTGGVKVKPCPVRLTRHTKAGIVVTVSGPGVINSYLGKLNGCFSGKLCYNAEREGSSQVQWRITSGRACGGADVEFDGVNASGGQVGYFFLRVSNRYCP